MLKIFLSHNTADKPLVENLAIRLGAEDKNFSPWLDKWDLIPGEAWQEGLEKALKNSDVCLFFIGAHGQGPWHQAEMRLALNRNISEKSLRVIPVFLPDAPDDAIEKLPDFLQAYNGVQFRHSLDDSDAFQRLVAGIRNERPGAGDTDNLPNPYRGLQFFDIEHAPLFFGRENVVNHILKHFRSLSEGNSRSPDSANRFLAVTGASGSGKSSVVRAGLLASLKNGVLPTSQNWPQVTFKPGEKPLQSLAVALNANPNLKRYGEVPDLIEKFYQEPLQLHYMTLEWLHGDDKRYLLVFADQFEEVFTLCQNEVERQALLDNLLSAVEEPTGRVIVILTLRADFYAYYTAYPQLSRFLESNQFILNPMLESQLRGAIVNPARKVGCELESGLTEVMMADIQEQPGILPLLQFTLMLLFEQRTSRTLRLSDYKSFGGLKGALERKANQLYDGFSAEEKVQCRLVFLRLVQPGKGTADARRRARLDELDQQEGTQRVIQHMIDARLLTTQREEGVAFVEVAHEALIRSWSLLREWIDSDRELLRIQHQVSAAAADWITHDEDESWLLSGSRLVIVEEWARDCSGSANEIEVRFVASSVEARELGRRKESKRQSQLKGLTVAMCLLAVAMLAATFFSMRSREVAVEAQKNTEQALNLVEAQQNKTKNALQSAELARDRAEYNANLALGNSYLNASKANLVSNPTLAIRLAEYAYNFAKSKGIDLEKFEDQLITAFYTDSNFYLTGSGAGIPEEEREGEGESTKIHAPYPSLTSFKGSILSYSDKRGVELNVDKKKIRVMSAMNKDGEFYWMRPILWYSFSPKGSYVLVLSRVIQTSGQYLDQLWLFDSSGERATRKIEKNDVADAESGTDFLEFTIYPADIKFNMDESRFLVYGYDTGVFLYYANDGQVERVPLNQSQGEALSIGLSSDGRIAAYGLKNGKIQVLRFSEKNIDQQDTWELNGHWSTGVHSIDFSEDGLYFTTVSNKVTRRWSTKNNKLNKYLTLRMGIPKIEYKSDDVLVSDYEFSNNEGIISFDDDRRKYKYINKSGDIVFNFEKNDYYGQPISRWNSPDGRYYATKNGLFNREDEQLILFEEIEYGYKWYRNEIGFSDNSKAFFILDKLILLNAQEIISRLNNDKLFGSVEKLSAEERNKYEINECQGNC